MISIPTKEIKKIRSKIGFGCRGSFWALILTAAILTQSANVDARSHSRGQAGKFDYFALVISWSPTFCATQDPRRHRLQCQGERPYAFVLHGLWPQYNRGWPQFCGVKNNWIPNSTILRMLDIMPSRPLIIHEWKKHGTCSGLGPEGYYDVARGLFEKIKIPDRYRQPDSAILVSPRELENDFLQSNSALRPEMISISCGNRNRLREIRICFDKNLQFKPCGSNEAQKRLCRSDKIYLPPVR